MKTFFDLSEFDQRQVEAANKTGLKIHYIESG